jgi:hypothetical protein
MFKLGSTYKYVGYEYACSLPYLMNILQDLNLETQLKI